VPKDRHKDPSNENKKGATPHSPEEAQPSTKKKSSKGLIFSSQKSNIKPNDSDAQVQEVERLSHDILEILKMKPKKP
jgi:Ulp1 family protease